MAIEIPRSRLPADLIVTDECERMVRHFEGFRPVAYKDMGGIWTIGYGFTDGVKPGDTISMIDANERLRAELEEHAQIVRDAIPDVPLSQGQFNALVSYTYNIGRLLETLLAKLKARDYAGAQAEIPRACRVDGKPVKGVYRRRLAETCMWDGLPWEGATAPHLIQVVADAQGRLDFSPGKTTTLEEVLLRARQDTTTTDIRAKYPGAPPIIPSPAPAVPPVVADELVLDKPAPEIPETALPDDGPVEAGPAPVLIPPKPAPAPVASPPVVVARPTAPPAPPVIIAPKTVDVHSIPYGEVSPDNGAKNMSESQRGVGMVIVGAGSLIQIVTARLGVGTALGAVAFDLSRDPVVIALLATGIVTLIGWLMRKKGTKVMTKGMVDATQVLK